MALIMTRVDYLFTRYTVVGPYVVFFSFSSGSHVSWLPGVTIPLHVYKRFVSSSRLVDYGVASEINMGHDLVFGWQ
jgi:hypothetical protein